MTNLAPNLISAPTAAPVMLVEVKSHLRIEHDEQNALLTSLIGASTRNLDGRSGILGRCIMPQTWRSYCCSIADTRLPFVDARSAVIRYFDTANVQQTLATTAYSVLNDEGGGFIRIDPNATIPSVYDRPDAVWIDVVYSIDDAYLEPVRAIIKLMVEQLFDGSDRKAAIDSLVAPLRMGSV